MAQRVVRRPAALWLSQDILARATSSTPCTGAATRAVTGAERFGRSRAVGTFAILVAVLSLAGCPRDPVDASDFASKVDAPDGAGELGEVTVTPDAVMDGAPDAGTVDAGPTDTGLLDDTLDGGQVSDTPDAGPVDTGSVDDTVDSEGDNDGGSIDGGVGDIDTGDAGNADAGSVQAKGYRIFGGLAAGPQVQTIKYGIQPVANITPQAAAVDYRIIGGLGP